MRRMARHIIAALLIAPLGAPAQQAGAPHSAHDIVVKQLMTKALSDIPDKEVLAITVDYPPGGADPIHRHDAHAFVYVLEGSIVMGVKGGKEVTLKPGETFYEGPDDVHTVGRNANKTEPAKFLVMMVKNQGTEFFLPVK